MAYLIDDLQTNGELRTTAARLAGALSHKPTAAVVVASLGVTALFLPSFSVVFLALALLAAGGYYLLPSKAPMSEPGRAGEGKDSDPAGKRRDGSFFLGNDRHTDGELWLSDDDCRSHFVVVGACGAGKTETLVGFGANALNWSSGLIFLDGKGDVAVFAKIYALARKYGREDDILVLNCLGVEDGRTLSHTINPFSSGDGAALAEVVNAAAFAPGEAPDARSSAAMLAVLRALAEKRDAGRLDLTAAIVLSSLRFDAVVQQSGDETASGETRTALGDYLHSLSGYAANISECETARNEHALAMMPYTRCLEVFVQHFAHVFSGGGIDMNDVIDNRRILVVLLPALEKTSDHVSTIGRMVLANYRKSTAISLNRVVKGRYNEVVDVRKSVQSTSTMFAIWDEVGYYCINGMDILAAQSRSRGCSMVYTAQDINAMGNMEDKAVGNIFANANTKIVMRIEDPSTARTAVEMCGRIYEQVREGLGFLRLKSLRAGQMLVINKDRTMPVSGFFANPEASLDRHKLRLRMCELLTLAQPTPDVIEQWKILEATDSSK